MHPHDPRRPGQGGPPAGGPGFGNAQGFGTGPGYQPPGYRPTVPSGSGGPRREPPPNAPSRPSTPSRSPGPSRPPGRGRAVQIDPVLVEIVAALAWLAVGTLGLGAAGLGTLLLAAGIGVGGWILVENRRQGSRPLDPARSVELLRLAGGAVVIVIVASVLFGLIGWSAFLPGLAAAVTGGAFLMLSTATGQRATRWLGIALVGLGLVSAFVSTQSATGFFSQGVVGLLAGVLLMVSAADRVGLLEMLRDRYR